MTEISRRALDAAATFGGSIRAAREALGLSQAGCARSMGVTKNCLHSLEQGTDARMRTAMTALAMLGGSMEAMRTAIGFSESQIGKQAGLAAPIVRAIEAGLSFDMPAVVQLASVYKGLARSASVAENQIQERRVKLPEAITDRYLTSPQAASRLCRTDRWLRNLRRQDRGPPVLNYHGIPLYDPVAVDNWAIAQVTAGKSRSGPPRK